MPQLNALARSLPSGLPLVGLAVGSASRTDAIRYRSGLGASFAILPDPAGIISERAGAVCSLDIALVGGDGTVRHVWEGIGKQTVAGLELEIGDRLGRNVMFDGRQFSDVVQTGCRLRETGAPSRD